MPGWQRKFTLATQTIQYTVGGLQRKFTLSETIQTQNTAIKEAGKEISTYWAQTNDKEVSTTTEKAHYKGLSSGRA